MPATKKTSDSKDKSGEFYTPTRDEILSRYLPKIKGIPGFSWTKEHEDEYIRLLQDYSEHNQNLPSILPNKEEFLRLSQDYLEHNLPSFLPNYVAAPNIPEEVKTNPIDSFDILAAFYEEYAHVLTDRGEQTSLFGAPELTPEQKRVWSNYYEMEPDARRFWLLFCGSSTASCIFALREWGKDGSRGKKIIANVTIPRIDGYTVGLSKFINLAFNNTLTPEPQLIALEDSRRKRGKEITALASLKFSQELQKLLQEELTLSQEALEQVKKQLRDLDMYDKQVYKAAAGLYNQYEQAFKNVGVDFVAISPQMIHRALNGPSARLRYGSEEYKRIVDSMKKLLVYAIDIDTADKDKTGQPIYNRLIRQRYFGPLLMGEYEEHQIIMLNGQETTGFFKIYRRPVLHQVSLDAGQITYIPTSWLELPGMSATRYAITIKNELAERVAWRTNARTRGKPVSDKMNFEPLYDAVGIPKENTPVNKNKRKKVRDTAKQVLNHLAEVGAIESWEETQPAKGSGNKKRGVQMKLREKKSK